MYRVAVVVGILAGLGRDAHAQTGAPSDAGGVQLQLGTKNDQTVFHVGEVITLQLAYSRAASSHNTYVISNNSYDRSGRLGIESYGIEPSTGWDDPLKLYFRSSGGFIGGGPFSTSKLTTTPVIISRDLNEWVRFTMPGQYRVSVVSTRVQPVHQAVASTPLEVRPNEISARRKICPRQFASRLLVAAPISDGPIPSRARK